MKKLLFVALFLMFLLKSQAYLPKYGSGPAEKFGNTLNIGVGLGYYGYIGSPVPAIFFNYEFDLARNWTLAPFIGLYGYSKSYWWGSNKYPFRYYTYTERVVPIGVKGIYYFDELFRASSKWDFYAAVSAGFSYRTVSWEDGYYGDTKVAKTASPLYTSGHVGARCHLKKNVAIFLDLSNSLSTFGVSFKFSDSGESKGK